MRHCERPYLDGDDERLLKLYGSASAVLWAVAALAAAWVVGGLLGMAL